MTTTTTALAAGRDVAVTAGTIARTCLDAGLLDEVAVELVPVVMGDGRPYFGATPVGGAPLGEPTRASNPRALATPVPGDARS